MASSVFSPGRQGEEPAIRYHPIWCVPERLTQLATARIIAALATCRLSPRSSHHRRPTMCSNQLTRLGDLRANGILTDAEFDTQEARIISA